MNEETRAALTAFKEEVQLMLKEDADMIDNHHKDWSIERRDIMNLGQTFLAIELAVNEVPEHIPLRCPKCGHGTIEHGVGSSTLAYYPVVTDETGKNINPDMNTVTQAYACRGCGHKWERKTRGGVEVDA